MSSRMDKYKGQIDETPSRSNKNKDLYQSINKSEISRFKSYDNAKVIDEGAKDIDLNKIRNYVETLNNQEVPKQRRTLVEDKGLYAPKEREEEKTKDYDINSILEKARDQREKNYEQEKYKKLRDTQFDILSKLKILDDEQPEPPDEGFTTEEKTLIDLINTVADNKNKNDLLSELQEETIELTKQNQDLINKIEQTKDQEQMKEMVSEEVTKELLKKDFEEAKEEMKNKPEVQQVDDPFFTNSLSFSKDDFDDGEEKTGSFGATIGIIFLIIFIIAIVIGIMYFVFNIDVIEYIKNYANKLITKVTK